MNGHTVGKNLTAVNSEHRKKRQNNSCHLIKRLKNWSLLRLKLHGLHDLHNLISCQP